MLTAKELIEQLETMPQDAPILLGTDQELNGTYRPSEASLEAAELGEYSAQDELYFWEEGEDVPAGVTVVVVIA